MAKPSKRKSRSIAFQLDPKNLIEFDGIAFDFNTQTLHGVKNDKLCPLIGKSRLEYKRDRDNGNPKMLHASSSATDENYINSNHQLASYDHLIAVDTNTHHINGSAVSLTAAFHLKREIKAGATVSFSGGILALLEFWNATLSAENIGWWQVMQAVNSTQESFLGQIGLIVDSDLGNHQQFNNREIPIVGDFYLPENTTIIYASDKGGSEHLSTKMIKYCHDVARDLYVPHKLVMNTKDLYPGVPGIYSHFRQWASDSVTRKFIPD